jgi:hypothetical protein
MVVKIQITLSLRELWRAAGTFEAVFLAFFHPRITGKKAAFLQHMP